MNDFQYKFFEFKLEPKITHTWNF